MTLLTFHGMPLGKDLLLQRVAGHEAADDIGQGTYIPTANRQPRYCAVGCLARDAGDTSRPSSEASKLFDVLLGEDPDINIEVWHAELQLQWGIPWRLASHADYIHEGLVDCRSWPRRFAEALPVGVDLSDMPWEKYYQMMWDQVETSKMAEELLRDLAGYES